MPAAWKQEGANLSEKRRDSCTRRSNSGSLSGVGTSSKAQRSRKCSFDAAAALRVFAAHFAVKSSGVTCERSGRFAPVCLIARPAQPGGPLSRVLPHRAQCGSRERMLPADLNRPHCLKSVRRIQVSGCNRRKWVRKFKTMKIGRVKTAVENANLSNKFKMVPRGGIEPPTLRFSVACSTN